VSVVELIFRWCEKSMGTALYKVDTYEDLVGGAFEEQQKKAPARGACGGGGEQPSRGRGKLLYWPQRLRSSWDLRSAAFRSLSLPLRFKISITVSAQLKKSSRPFDWVQRGL